MEERRKYQRIAITLSAQYKLSKNSPYTSTILNLSAEGICFTTNHALEAGDEVDLKVRLEDDSAELKVEVVWCELSERDKKFRIGVKIVEANSADEEKFIRFYCSKTLFVPDARKKILVIDDEPDMVKLLKLELEAEGFNVIFSHDGKEGYEKYLAEKPDLILLDLMLPELNGHEVCRMIRRNNHDTATPIIMITAKTDAVDRIRGRVIGAEKYFTKPFHMEDLLVAIKDFLTKRGGNHDQQ